VKRLNGYIFKVILAATIIVLLVICSLDFIGKLIDELGKINEQYTFVEVLIYVGLKFPINIYNYLPFSALVGCLIGLGSLATSSELVVMRAAGVSIYRIGFSALRPILLLIIFALLMAEFIIPVSEQYSENRRSVKLEGSQSALSSRFGLWHREGNEFMHFNSVQSNGILLGITRYRFDDNNELQVSSFSKSAIYAGNAWQEEDVNETVFSNGEVIQNSYAQRPWNVSLSPALLAILIQNSDNLSISKLQYYINYLDQQNLDSSRYQLSFWNKVFQPLAIISLVMIAISFIFGPLRESTMGYRIFTGVLIGIVFQLSQRLLGPVSLVYGFHPLIAVIIPIMVCLIFGSVLLSRVR
jgi:lipopolysaccharide export system permease protein